MSPEESLDERIARLRRYALTGQPIPAGRLLGLPELPDGGVWADMAGVALVTGHPPHTITSWLSRGGPRYGPFPGRPKQMYQMYWPLSEVMTWAAETAPYREKHGFPFRMQL